MGKVLISAEVVDPEALIESLNALETNERAEMRRVQAIRCIVLRY